MQSVFQALKFNKKDVKLFLVGLFGSLVSRGMALFSFGYAVDDYSMMLGPTRNGYLLISYGRWGAAIVNKALSFLGIEANYGSPFLVLLSFLAFAYAAVLLCKIWGINNNFWLSSLVILIFITHPYQSGVHIYGMQNVLIGLGLLLTFVALYISNKKNLWGARIISVLLFCFALSLYQLFINYALATVGVLVFLLFLENIKKEKSVFKTIVSVLKKTSSYLYTIIFGTAIYGVISWIFIQFVKENAYYRTELLSFKLEAINIRIQEFFQLYHFIFLKDEPIIAGFVKIILLVILVLTIVVLIRNISQKKVSVILSVLALVAVIFLTIAGMTLPLKTWDPTLRTYANLGIVWGGIITAGYLTAHLRITKKTIIILSTLVIISFISANNHIFIDRARVNEFDKAMSNRIVSKLENKGNINFVKKVAIIGFYKHPQRVRTMYGAINSSIFMTPLEKVYALNEYTGYYFSKPNEDELEKAKTICAESKKWPEPDSVKIEDNLGIVCLENDFKN